ncbi:MAG: hypothetical protein NVS1B14_00080 [Vulcanimicrobiaceae bacterium]
MKAVYDFVAGGSRVTPLGVAASALVAIALLRTPFHAYAAAAFVVLLLATLALAAFEDPR